MKQNRLRIFVVDDEEILATTLAMILQHHGFDAIAFTEPLRALEAACLTPPCLVISDVLMPLMSGYELALNFNRSCPGCKFILFTGEALGNDLRQTLGEGGQCLEVLLKPMHPADVVHKVEAMTAGIQ